MRLTSHYSLALAAMSATAMAKISEENLPGYDQYSNRKKEHVGLVGQILELVENCKEFDDCQKNIDEALEKVKNENFQEDEDKMLILTAAENAQAGLDRQNKGQMRALLRSDMGLLDQYACWCYFEGDVGMGAGKPIDTIDEFCRTLQKGYECIIMDHADGGDNGEDPDCIPWDHVGNSAFGSGVNPFGLNIDNIITECEIQNPVQHSCARKVCIVEGFFVMQYFNYAIFGGTINRTLQHEQGFDSNSQCLKSGPAPPTGDPFTAYPPDNDFEPNPPNGYPGIPGPTPVPVYEDCCGSYPFRAPYWHRANHQCCQTVTLFDATQSACCSDGTIETSALNCPGGAVV